jgi:hypothetical protein
METNPGDDTPPDGEAELPRIDRALLHLETVVSEAVARLEVAASDHVTRRSSGSLLTLIRAAASVSAAARLDSDEGALRGSS